jgi:hypothetical protein
MEKIHTNINIAFDGQELYIAEESSSGCSYSIKNKKELLDNIIGYVLDCIDQTNEFDFELKSNKEKMITVENNNKDNFSLKYYVYNNINAQQDKVKPEILRFDDLQSAIQKFMELPSEWKSALGCTLNEASEIDLIHKVDGKAMLIMDYQNIEKYKDNKDVQSAIKELKETFHLENSKENDSEEHQLDQLLAKAFENEFAEDYYKLGNYAIAFEDRPWETLFWVYEDTIPVLQGSILDKKIEFNVKDINIEKYIKAFTQEELSDLNFKFVGKIYDEYQKNKNTKGLSYIKNLGTKSEKSADKPKEKELDL